MYNYRLNGLIVQMKKHNILITPNKWLTNITKPNGAAVARWVELVD